MTDAALPSGTADELASFLDRWVGDGVPGLSVAVFDADGRLHADALGVRDVASGTPATPETTYAVGSLAKPPTALAVLQLVESGAVALTDPVDEHLPRPVLADAPGEPVTVADLLAHRSGMPRDFYASRDDLDDREAVFRHVEAAASQRRTDRERYAYWNSGYVLLGELVEAVDGRPHSRYVAESVLEPLGMDRSGFTPALLDGEDAATGYPPGSEEAVPAAVVADEVEQAAASGGFVSTATDLARLGRWLLNDGVVDGSRLLGDSLAAEITTFQSPVAETTAGERWGYGYGLELDTFLGGPLVGHRGGLHFSGGFLGVLPERDRGVALAYNSTGLPAVSVGRGALALACGEAPTDAVRTLAVAEAVDAVAGRYTSVRDVTGATVEAGPAGTLRIDLDAPPVTFTAAPEAVDGADATFAAETGDGKRWLAEFSATEDGVELLLTTGKWVTLFEQT